MWVRGSPSSAASLHVGVRDELLGGVIIAGSPYVHHCRMRIYQNFRTQKRFLMAVHVVHGTGPKETTAANKTPRVLPIEGVCVQPIRNFNEDACG